VKIAIIGNGGGGKTTLARAIASRYGLKLTHVDSIQFLAGMKVRDREETSRLLNALADEPSWVIDGFGRLDVMTRRFEIADRIVFVDFPLWRHYWWCTKRQVKSLWAPRSELPDGCNEATFSYTIELYKTLWRVHRTIRPELLKIFARPEIAGKVVKVRTMPEWNAV
jgi:adenylate kinase family enzyme